MESTLAYPKIPFVTIKIPPIPELSDSAIIHKSSEIPNLSKKGKKSKIKNQNVQIDTTVKNTHMILNIIDEEKEPKEISEIDPIVENNPMILNIIDEQKELSDIEMAQIFMQIINPNRFLKENFWLDIGSALSTIYKQQDEGCEIWRIYTEKATNNSPPEFMLTMSTLTDTCVHLYSKFPNGSLTIKTLGWYAREDSKTEYDNWHHKVSLQYMTQALNCQAKDVAKALYFHNWLDITYCPNGTWWKFSKNKWTEDHQGIEIRKKISTDLIKCFERIYHPIEIVKLISNLKSATFKTNVINSASDLFMDKYPYNANKSLIAVANGILESFETNILFRTGKPEDRITKSMTIPYNKDYTWETPIVIECIEFMKQFFPKKKFYNDFMKFVVSRLKGHNTIIPIFSGIDSKYKFYILTLLMKTCGIYCDASVQTNLTSKNRIIIADINEPGGIFNHDYGDNIPSFVFICNELPIILNPNKELLNKIYVYPSVSNWVDDLKQLDNEPDDEDSKFLFQKDPNISQKIEKLAPALLWIIINSNELANKMPTSKTVTSATNKFKDDLNIYLLFTKDFINPNSNSQININDLYPYFKSWFQEHSHGNKTPPSKDIFTNECSKILGPIKNNIWLGFEIKRS